MDMPRRSLNEEEVPTQILTAEETERAKAALIRPSTPPAPQPGAASPSLAVSADFPESERVSLLDMEGVTFADAQDEPTTRGSSPSRISGFLTSEVPTAVARAPRSTLPTMGAFEDLSGEELAEGEDPSDGLESLPPSAPKLREPLEAGEVTFEHERPAATHLAERNQRGQFAARAEWLEREAETAHDAHSKAKRLLVASELWALTGNIERARGAARAATSALGSLPLVGRQLRWLAATERDTRTVVASLEAELRASPTAEARVHGAYLSAELHRLELGDEDGTQRKLELASRIQPGDARAHVLRLAQALALEPEAPRVTLPEAPALAALASALDHVAQRRTGTPGSGHVPDDVAVEHARRSIVAGQGVEAADSVLKLGRLSGLARSAHWLAASLLAVNPDTRERAAVLLAHLTAERATPAALKAQVWRALERGDGKALTAALTRDEGQRTFSPADRVALGALTGADPSSWDTALRATALEAELRPLAAAALAASMAPGQPLEVQSGEEASRAAAGLGRALAAGDKEVLRDAFDRFSSQHLTLPLTRWLGLELGFVAQDALDIAERLASTARPTDAADIHERRVLAGLLLESVLEREPRADARARAAYAEALKADPKSTLAVRALASTSGPRGAADLLSGWADAAEDETERSLAYLEAALLRMREPGEHEAALALLEKARDLAPALPFAGALGSRLARRAQDEATALRWMRARRQAATDPFERALDSVREALLIADSDLSLARELVAEACSARPLDAGLQELAERLSPEPAAERAEWREALAQDADAATRRFLLAGAALEFWAAGSLDAVTRSAEGAAEDEVLGLLGDECAARGAGAATLASKLLGRAKGEDDLDLQQELYEKLSQLDRARGEEASATLWQTAILERSPDHLPALRRLEHTYFDAGRSEELEPIAARLAQLLDLPEARAHAVFAVRARTRAGAWESGAELVRDLVKKGAEDLWTLRRASAYAEALQDHAETVSVLQKLAARAPTALDGAALALRAAEAAVCTGQLDQARDFLEDAVERLPENLVALTRQASVLRTLGDHEGASLALEAAAQASQVDATRIELWLEAATAWQDRVGDRDRARNALEHAADLDITHDVVFERLRDLYVALADGTALAALLERRLERTTDPAARVALEVTRGRALAALGDRASAKTALQAALDTDPEHADALGALADLCEAEGDASGAEEVLVRLATLLTDADAQARVFTRLGGLYLGALGEPERAERAYSAVLERHPQDDAAREALVSVYGALGQPARAISMAEALIENAETPEAKCRRTLELARVHEEFANDGKTAEAVLERARKAWPNDSRTLRGQATLYQRRGDTKALHMLLERASTEARRSLNTGRFEPPLFEALATVAELRGGEGAQKLAEATLAVLDGKSERYEGGGGNAGSSDLDDLLAPDVVGTPFRALLRRAGAALDQAFPYDLRAIRAAPLSGEHAALADEIQRLASRFRLNQLEVYVTPALGPVCVPASSHPPRIVLGQKLVESPDEAARAFMLYRTLKIVQASASPISRAAPIDLWPMLAGFLCSLASGFTPVGVEAKKLEEAKAKVSAVLSGKTDPETSVLALEVAGQIGSRASQLGVTVNQWGNRVGLLATGDLEAALRGIAFAQGNTGGPPREGAERTKWVARNPEARDLAVFSVSEQFVRARQQLGLG
jgi:tetratricopeptide (TPR) repeat protein